MLDKVETGKRDKPPRLLVWGPPGVGKSTFAAGAPDALFICGESRTDHLDISRIHVKSWQEVIDSIKALLAKEHPYKSVVFDTVDSLESLLFEALCEEQGVEIHEDIGGGFYKYRTYMNRKWKVFLKGIDRLTEAGIQCILLAHAKTENFNPPDGESYERYILKMDKAGGNFLVENVDLVGYAKFKTFVTKDKITKKGKATTSGKRSLQFKFHPAYPTKQGVPFADEIDLSWEAFENGKP